MKRRNFLWTLGSAAACTAFGARPLLAQAKKGRVLYFTRSVGFEHSPVKREGSELAFSEKALVEWGKEAGFDVECSKDGRIFDQDLDKYDVFAFYTCGDLTKEDKYGNPPMTADGKKRFLDAIAAGKGYVGFHSATDTFHSAGGRDQVQTEVDPYVAMVGGEFIVHGRQQEATMRVTSPEFPGVKEMGEASKFMEEWYALKNFAKDMHVILLQETEGMVDDCYQRPPFPATWARMHGKGRVYYTSFGHREDIWTNPKVKGLVLGGFEWALGRVDTDVTPNLARVAPKADELPKLAPRQPKPKAKVKAAKQPT
ncbi:MAG: ThuA domain-containing protein [Pirellulaceae bacterium]|nr:ThuA domain-containing protein [Pirellulaceae bacterium]